MKKALFFVLIFASLHSCKKQDSFEQDTSGKVNSVSIIIDDLLWQGEIGDSLRNKFASPVLGLPQEEPLFTINQYPVKLLEGYMANSRNIIIVKKGVRNYFDVTHDEIRKPQTVIRIYGKTSRDLLRMIEERSSEIITKIHQKEIEQVTETYRQTPLNTKRIADKFMIKLDIPEPYRYVMEKPKFLWLKREIVSGNTNLLVYEIPLNSVIKDGDAVNDIIRVRDSVGKLYIHGSVPGTHMITEGSYSPYLSVMSVCNRTAFETRGTWELDNDFMSGPFINYCIVDEPGNRMIVLEGFCYAPSKEKRDLMLELEAIVKSVKFLKRK